MNRFRMSVISASVLGLLLGFSAAEARRVCPAYNDIYCGMYCTWGGWGVGCFDEAPASRCCYDNGTGNTCGEAYQCDECGCRNGISGF